MADTTGARTPIHVEPSDVLDTIRRHMLVDGFPIVVDLEESQGVRMKDRATGREYLDFFQFFASMPVGFNHPRLTEREFVERLAKVAVNKPSNSDFYAQEMAEYVQAMDQYGIPDELPHLFLVSGGTLAVENALKAAFDWKVRKNMARGARGEVGTKVIHFREAFHGRSGYCLSLTNTDPVKILYYPKFQWPRITTPKITFPLDRHKGDVIALEEKAKAEIKAAIREHGDDIAALIIEPIQCEGGDNHFRPEFMRFLREITEENEILFILDEVQTGVGVTGKFWGYEHTGVVPDILAFGKKMQVCGILASNKLDEVDGVFKVPSRINSTWGGSLTDMVRATRYLQIIDDENLIENARVVGDYLLEKLVELGAKHAGVVSNCRGLGLLAAFDVPSHEFRAKFLAKARENGLIVVGCGTHSVRFRPPLNVTKAEVDEALDIVDRTVRVAAA